MSNYEIIHVPILPFKMVNSYIIKGPLGCIVVDAGLPGSEKKYEKILKKNNLNFNDLKLIIITHAHVDHAGGADALRLLSGAPIVAHEGDLKYYLRQEEMTFCPTGIFGRFFLKTGLMFEPYKAFRPDILLSQGQKLDLKQYGFQGYVQHTPGHTAGSISVVLKDQQAFVGDLLASGILLGGIAFTNIPKRPPFEENPIEVANQLKMLVSKGINKFFIGHGGPVNSKIVSKHASELIKLK